MNLDENEELLEPSKENRQAPYKWLLGLLFLFLFGLTGGYLSVSLPDAFHPQPPARSQEEIALIGKDGLYFLELPSFQVNLNDQRQNFSILQTTLALELNRPTDKKDILAVMPRIQDSILTYLREVRPEELQETGGLYRLKEALLERINFLIAPAHINDVLFKEMFVQQRK